MISGTAPPEEPYAFYVGPHFARAAGRIAGEQIAPRSFARSPEDVAVGRVQPQ